MAFRPARFVSSETYNECAANDISALRFSIIARQMRFSVWRMAVILAIISNPMSLGGCLIFLFLLVAGLV